MIDPDFRDYGRPVEYDWRIGDRIAGTERGTIHRTLNDGTLYEVHVIPEGDESRATTFRIRAADVRFLDRA